MFQTQDLIESIVACSGAGGVGGETVLAWLAREAPDTALAAVVTAASALWWPDDVVGRAAVFCRWVQGS